MSNIKVNVDFRLWANNADRFVHLQVEGESHSPFVDALADAALLSGAAGIENGLLWRHGGESDLAVSLHINR
ncbi:hypothetical protein E3T39_01930 [Cryobacterium suzukii]|uniref:Uncharacterized protein n=1 Tax=Cryobacterium suzukii TaxID=1259198 RepID=A0A4V3IT01_9MICO|nr:hypothetical protein [Cryobacterium suzukii]TFD62721.1 hypothetical protein E3T39_01930 [Cryobacterium suzukii]